MTFHFQAEHLEEKFVECAPDYKAALSKKFFAESEQAAFKIQVLKQSIVKRGLPVRYFKTLQELGKIVLEDWSGILDTLFPPLSDNGAYLGMFETCVTHISAFSSVPLLFIIRLVLDR